MGNNDSLDVEQNRNRVSMNRPMSDDMNFTMTPQFMSSSNSSAQEPIVRTPDIDKTVVKKSENNKKVSSNKSSKKKSKKEVESDAYASSVVRNVPTIVLQQIRAEFPEATNQTDALMAYIVCHGDGPVVEKAKLVLTDAQLDLIKSWGGSSYSDMVQQITTLAKRMESMKHTSDIIELMMSYIVFDRLGFRQGNPGNPKDADLREDGVMEILLKAEQQIDGFQNEKNNILGRPIR